MSLIVKDLVEPNYQLLLKAFLNQRKIINNIKKQTLLNRSDLEILAYGFNKEIFNAYQIQRDFKIMNVQQIQKSLQKLQDLEMVEVIGKGCKGKPKTLILSYKGEETLINYLQKLIVS